MNEQEKQELAYRKIEWIINRINSDAKKIALRKKEKVQMSEQGKKRVPQFKDKTFCWHEFEFLEKPISLVSLKYRLRNEPDGFYNLKIYGSIYGKELKFKGNGISCPLKIIKKESKFFFLIYPKFYGRVKEVMKKQLSNRIINPT